MADTAPCSKCRTPVLLTSIRCTKCNHPRPVAGITPLEPMAEWDCPLCFYRIRDEESIVDDAVWHHKKEAHTVGEWPDIRYQLGKERV